MSAGRELAAAGEVQNAAERSLFVPIGARELGADGPPLGLRATETGAQPDRDPSAMAAGWPRGFFFGLVDTASGSELWCFGTKLTPHAQRRSASNLPDGFHREHERLLNPPGLTC